MISILKRHYILLLLLLTAFLLRIFLAVTLQHPNFLINDDLHRYQDWGKVAYLHGVSDTYKTTHMTFGSNPNNQPPGTVYIDLAMYSLYHLVSALPHVTSDVYTLFIKLPSIIADLIIGTLIYYTVLRNTKQKYALMASALFLYNPVIIYNSTVWGQTDALNNVLFFTSLTFLFAKKYFPSVLMFFLSLYIKLSLLPLLPLLLLILIKQMKFDIKRLCLYVLVSFSILMFLTLPVSQNPLNWSIQFFMQNAAGELQHITNYTFNFWSMIFNPDAFALIPLSSAIYFGLPLATWAYMIFGVVFIPLFILTAKTKKLSDSFILGMFLISALAAFLFLPRMHQRYLYPMIPLLATYIGLQKKYYVEYMLLSLVNFINLYIVWHPSDFLPSVFSTFIAHSKVRLGLSTLMVILFILVYVKIFLLRNKNQITLKDDS